MSEERGVAVVLRIPKHLCVSVNEERGKGEGADVSKDRGEGEGAGLQAVSLLSDTQ